MLLCAGVYFELRTLKCQYHFACESIWQWYWLLITNFMHCWHLNYVSLITHIHALTESHIQTFTGTLLLCYYYRYTHNNIDFLLRNIFFSFRIIYWLINGSEWPNSTQNYFTLFDVGLMLVRITVFGGQSCYQFKYSKNMYIRTLMFLCLRKIIIKIYNKVKQSLQFFT